MTFDRVDDPALIEGYLTDASNLKGHATALVRPRSTAEVAAVLTHCQANGTPVTVSAQRTSTTGGPVPHGGWVLSMEHLNRLLWVEGDRARVQGGALLGAIQEELETQGWSFPPDPTSRHECTVGAAIACNASGARSYRFGPTRNWIESIEVVLPNGEIHEIGPEDRIPDSWPRCDWQPPSVKAAAGYSDTGRLLDLFIGQEGTLGVITEATLKLSPCPEHQFSLLTFFSELSDCLAFVHDLRSRGSEGEVSPASIEFYGPNAVSMIREAVGSLPPTAKYGIWCEQDGLTEEEDARLEAWFEALESGRALLDATVFAQDKGSRDRLARMRHAVPAGINEQVVANGMPKVGTDCSVPHDRLAEMIAVYKSVSLEHVLFGHIGDSHLHLNLLPTTAEELETAKELYRGICRKAVELGGCVSAEHGIGKLKRNHFRDMAGDEAIAQFQRLKRHIDPQWILGRGNLFEEGPV